jgi:hypothetical protein
MVARHAFPALLALALLGLGAAAVPAVAADSHTCYIPAGRLCVVGNGAGDYCTDEVEVNCNHETALGTCAIYVGGNNGSCVLY